MSPSLQTMGFFMSDINFCNTKEQLTHLGEVVTGKVDGSPTGADIDTSTLPYTGQVRKTLPALEGEYEQSITDKEAEADAAIDSYRLLNKGPYASGITLESKFEYITYNGKSYFATNPPYTTTATTPDADGNLFLGGYTTFENVANKIGNTNLLSNHNFIIQSPDAITHPNATPETYAAGTQIFSGVYAGSSGVTVTLIDGRVNCSAGSYEYRVPNTNGLDRVPVFASSVSDYDGIPKTTGVSHALVGDEYVVTVTPAAGDVFSVKLEQGGVATRHEVGSLSVGNLSDYTDRVYKSSVGSTPVGNMVEGSPIVADIGDVCSTGGTSWLRVSKSTPAVIGDFQPLTKVDSGDFGVREAGSFFDAVDSAIGASKGATVVVPEGTYDAGNVKRDMTFNRVNLHFDNVTVIFSGLTTNDTGSPLWSEAAWDINASKEMNIDGDLTIDFQNTYVYRGLRLREASLKNISGITVKNIRPPVNWKDNAPGLTSGAITLGAPTGAIVRDIRTENTYKFYQDGSEIAITASPATPLSRCVDVQGTFNNFTIKDCVFKDAMMGLLLQSGLGCTVENIETDGTLANSIYDLNCSDVVYRGCRIKSAKDQGITLSGRDKRIIGCSFDDVDGRPISIHAGDVEGLIVTGNVCRHSNINVSAEFVSIRTDAAANVRNNVVITGNVIHVAQCGFALINLGEVGKGCSVSGNSFYIGQFPNLDPANGSIISADSGEVNFSSNNIFYNDGNFIYCFRGTALMKSGANASNCALATFSPATLESALFSNTQKSLEGQPCDVEQFGTINMRLPDNVGTKGLGGNYAVAQGDINTFSTYQPATMGAYGFRWANGNNGDYDTVFEVLKPSQASQNLDAALRVDENGNLHLKTGATILYDL